LIGRRLPFPISELVPFATDRHLSRFQEDTTDRAR
jgi:hypothetical protein